MELGCVIGLPSREEHKDIRILDIESGGMHTPLTGTKDMFGNRCMGPAHTTYLGTQAEQNKTGINCVLLSTGVQPPENTADLI